MSKIFCSTRKWVTCSHVVSIQASGLTAMTFLTLQGSSNADAWSLEFCQSILKSSHVNNFNWTQFFIWIWPDQSESFVPMGRHHLVVQISRYCQRVLPHCDLLTPLEVKKSDWLPRRTLVQSPSGFKHKVQVSQASLFVYEWRMKSSQASWFIFVSNFKIKL